MKKKKKKSRGRMMSLLNLKRRKKGIDNTKALFSKLPRTHRLDLVTVYQKIDSISSNQKKTTTQLYTDQQVQDAYRMMQERKEA